VVETRTIFYIYQQWSPLLIVIASFFWAMPWRLVENWTTQFKSSERLFVLNRRNIQAKMQAQGLGLPDIHEPKFDNAIATQEKTSLGQYSPPHYI
jgi:hypothetical protein